jgi:hypothetical protein
MFQGDSDLIFKVKREQVKNILEAVLLSRDSQYLDLLRSLCVYGKNIIYDNQRLIVMELFQHFSNAIVKTSFKAPHGTFFSEFFEELNFVWTRFPFFFGMFFSEFYI